jgi:hypothetical protein
MSFCLLRLLVLAGVYLSCVPACLAQWKPPVIPARTSSPQWERILRNQLRYLLGVTAKGGTSSQPGERIREMSATAAGAAVCVRFEACEDRADVRDAAIDLLRAVGSAHNKSWGHDWMSAFYAWQAAFGGWLLWQDLPADVRASLNAMVIDEADRFLDLPAPYSRIVDTKGEENAWNSLILVFASEVLPEQAHTGRWRERALEYMVSVFATPKDGDSDERVDGRPLRKWLHGANVHSDYSIENHGIVHPDYYLIGPAMMLPSAIVYRLSGKAPPQAMSHNVRQVYQNLKLFCLPGGDLLYPYGTDRTPHRLEMTTTLHVFMERLFQDRDAGALAQDALATLEKMQARNPDGRTFVPGEFDHQKPAEGHAGLLYALSLIFTELWQAPPQPRRLPQVWQGLEGSKIFEDGRFFLTRTPQAISSFAWGSRLMAQTAPFRRERIVNPLPLSYVGLAEELQTAKGGAGKTGIGSAALAQAVKSEPLELQTVITGEESHATFASVQAIHGGRSHSFSFIALPNGKSAYMERWRGGGAAWGGLLSLLEEPSWIYGEAKRKIEGDGASWLNVDDRLGWVVSQGGGIRTRPDVNSVLIALNTSSTRDTVIVTLPDATRAATEEFATQLLRLPVQQGDVIAVAIDEFIIAGNLGSSPLRTVVGDKGHEIPLSINGHSVRVLRREGVTGSPSAEPQNSACRAGNELEEELQSHLDLPGQCCLRGNLTEGAQRRQTAGRRSEAGMVEGIEQLSAEIERLVLAQLKALADRHVEIEVRRCVFAGDGRITKLA